MNNNLNDERFWNMLIYKVYMTNAERDAAFNNPWYWGTLVAIILFLILIAFLMHSK